MSKKKWILILCSVVLLLAIVTGCTIQWFYSPGFHKLFGYAHVELNETGYLYQDGKILGKVDFSINTTVPLSDFRENADDEISLKFGDLLSISTPDSEYAFSSVLSAKENGYSMYISGVSREYESYRIDSNGAMTDIVLKYHSSNFLYLDEEGNVKTFHHKAADSEESYMLVFTDDPIEASNYIAEAVK